MPNKGTNKAVPARGRPSVKAERRAEIVNAYIELVADRGTAAVPIDAVAGHAGVARTAVRHFVGNRADLIDQAVVELVARYQRMVDTTLGPDPDPEDLVSLLFADDWVRNRPVEDQAFDLLVVEARRNPQIQALVAQAFRRLVDAIRTALAKRGPSLDPEKLHDAAYVIACISEHNVVLQALGFDAGRSRAAASHALRIVADLARDEAPT